VIFVGDHGTPLQYKVNSLHCVGSYGTRNIVVIGLEQQNDCIDVLSKFYSSGDSPSPVFTAVLEKSHVRHGANRRCLQSNTLPVALRLRC